MGGKIIPPCTLALTWPEFKSGKEKEKLAKHIFNMFHLSLQLHMLMEVKSFGKDHTLHSI